MSNHIHYGNIGCGVSSSGYTKFGRFFLGVNRLRLKDFMRWIDAGLTKIGPIFDK